ncbi:hypothetical protein BSKO_03049 [Bryopsis sp. KO-2023]|nr:hypothetical protein BSKO_03049 [Bryopsis sp. KO-2023]
MDAGDDIKEPEVVGEKRPRPETPEEDVIDELYDGMDLANDLSGADIQGEERDLQNEAHGIAVDDNDGVDGISNGEGEGGNDAQGGLLGVSHEHSDGNADADGTDTQEEDSEGDLEGEMNADVQGDGELELDQEEEGSPTRDVNDIDDEGTSSKGGGEADSEIDLEWELERGLQEASARNTMDSLGNTPTPSEDGGGTPLEKLVGVSGGQTGVIDNPDMLPPPAATVVEEDAGGELIEDVLLREVQEHGLTEAQLRRKEKEKHYAALLSTLHEKELDRYEAFRRSSLPRGKMRKLLMSISGQTINDEKVLIVVCSLAKMFVGELIEEARELATVDGYEGPILKSHIHRAYTQMEYEGRVKHRRMMKQFFKHL